MYVCVHVIRAACMLSGTNWAHVHACSLCACVHFSTKSGHIWPDWETKLRDKHTFPAHVRLDGNAVEGATNEVLPNPGEGVYTVWVTDFVDCPAVESVPLTYVGLFESPVLSSWSVGPNPFEAKVEIRVSSAWFEGRAVLRDGSGLRNCNSAICAHIATASLYIIY